MMTNSGTRLRRGHARARSGSGSGIVAAPLMLIAGLLAALAAFPWLLSMSARVPPPDMGAAPRGAPARSWELGARGPSYVTRLSEVGDEHARLVKERRAGCDESARPQRLAPARRAPTQVDRWLGQEPATCGQVGGLRPVVEASQSFEVAEKSRRTDARDGAPRTSLEGDVHAPRGPPAKRSV